jgi:hypothetical protein
MALFRLIEKTQRFRRAYGKNPKNLEDMEAPACKEHRRQECNAAYSGRSVLTFRRNVLLLFSRPAYSSTLSPFWEPQISQFPAKYRHNFAALENLDDNVDTNGNYEGESVNRSRMEVKQL